jgi:3-carboxy-cis,cis-muconate cycloisomerase
MPHKQNPVRAVRAVAAATRAPGLVATMLAAMPQEHERAAGGWQAEWDTFADLVSVTRDSTSSIAAGLSEVRVNADQMRVNLQQRGGLAMSESLSVALQSRIDRKAAMAHVERLSREVAKQKSTLLDVAVHDDEISKLLPREAIERALLPENFIGAAAELIERALKRWDA